MTKRFENRVAYITGAGSGLGRATAALFAADGARVFAVDINEAGVNEVIASIRAAGGEADGGRCDVSSSDDVKRSIRSAVDRFGGLQVLINAAGVGRAARLEEIDENEWQRVMSVNLNGVFYTTKAAMDHLLRNRFSTIVNVASIAGLRGQAYAAHYCASKAGLINFTRSIALEFASRGLRANCLCPAGIVSPLISHFIPREDFEPQLVAYYSPPVPGKMWEPEHAAKVIAFLASDDARMVNGAAMVADGGTLA